MPCSVSPSARAASMVFGFWVGSSFNVPSMDSSRTFTRYLSPLISRLMAFASSSGILLPSFWPETSDQVPCNFLRSPFGLSAAATRTNTGTSNRLFDMFTTPRMAKGSQVQAIEDIASKATSQHDTSGRSDSWRLVAESYVRNKKSYQLPDVW